MVPSVRQVLGDSDKAGLGQGRSPKRRVRHSSSADSETRTGAAKLTHVRVVSESVKADSAEILHASKQCSQVDEMQRPFFASVASGLAGHGLGPDRPIHLPVQPVCLCARTAPAVALTVWFI